ncbi:hypothetical protein Scep_023527 [Stephania cephalantha]|uniref:Uncharacterized protein n=1 Tax=Stephania cephalantha TaxID=152367 RepID=A0AAP0F097_9MAGN
MDVWTDLGTLYHSTCDHALGEFRPELHQCTRVGVSADLASAARTKDGTVEVVGEAPGKILSSEPESVERSTGNEDRKIKQRMQEEYTLTFEGPHAGRERDPVSQFRVQYVGNSSQSSRRRRGKANRRHRCFRCGQCGHDNKDYPWRPVSVTTAPPAPESDLHIDEPAQLGQECPLVCSHCRVERSHHFNSPLIFMPPILAIPLQVRAPVQDADMMYMKAMSDTFSSGQSTRVSLAIITIRLLPHEDEVMKGCIKGLAGHIVSGETPKDTIMRRSEGLDLGDHSSVSGSLSGRIRGSEEVGAQIEVRFLHRDVWTDLGTLYHSTCNHALGELRIELHQCTRVSVSADLASAARTKYGTVEVVGEAPGKILSSEMSLDNNINVISVRFEPERLVDLCWTVSAEPGPTQKHVTSFRDEVPNNGHAGTCGD